MAKLAFTKLGLKIPNDINTLIINEQTIEVKNYLPIQDKLEIMTNAMTLENTYNNNRFLNFPMLKMFIDLEFIYAYTNINFTEKQKEDFVKTYDLLKSNDVINKIIGLVEDEYYYILNETIESAEAAYDYTNSIYGILDSLQTDYSNLNLNAADIQQKLADPENMDLLKQVLTKLG